MRTQIGAGASEAVGKGILQRKKPGLAGGALGCNGPGRGVGGVGSSAVHLCPQAVQQRAQQHCPLLPDKPKPPRVQRSAVPALPQGPAGSAAAQGLHYIG